MRDLKGNREPADCTPIFLKQRKMKKQIDVVIIYCMVGTAKYYVSSVSRRWDDRILPRYTEDHLQAFRCQDENHAAELISEVHEGIRKTFKTEWITVAQEPAVRFGALVHGALI